MLRSGLKKFKNNLGEKISRHLKLPLAKPQGVDFMITGECNYHCVHCNIWQEQGQPDLDLVCWQKIITDLRQWLGADFPVSVNGGEPLMRKDILEIINFLHKNNFQVTLVTNGYLIDEVMAQKLVSSGLSEIRISLYSLSPELYNQMRGVADAHQKTLAALKFLKQEKNKQNSQVKICLALLINAKNIGPKALDLINWAKEQGFHVLIQALDENFTGEGSEETWYEKNPFWPRDKEQINNFLDQIIAFKKQDFKIDNTFKTLEAFKQYFLNPKASAGINCSVGYRTMNINPQGQLFFCFKTSNTPKSLADYSAQELWRSSELEAKRKLVSDCSKICRIRCYYQDNLLDKTLNFLRKE